jgi:branched-chain amino acid transport system substrate-binding protein
MPCTLRRLALLLAASLASTLAQADVTIGVTLSTTGPAASLGIPEQNTINLLPKTIAGQKINYVVLDDRSDTATAAANTKRLLVESKADLIMGSTTTPNSLAMIDTVAEAATPMISLAASARIVEPVDAKKRWVFKTAHSDIMMALAIAEHMANSGVKKVGFIGFADAYGEGWLQEFGKAAGLKKIEIVATERYARTDNSVTSQILKLTGANPDAVLIAGSGTPAALPARALAERGYKGKVYQTHGVANADFLRVGGKDVEGTLLPAGPVLVAQQLPANHPMKKSAMAYVTAYEAVHGAGSTNTFGAGAWDAGLLIQAAVPVALKKAQPGTPEFRAALRDALEQVKELPAALAIYNMSPQDHLGMDQRSRVMVKIEGGKWVLQR